MFKYSKSWHASFCWAIVVMAGCSLRSEPRDRWIRVRISAPGLSAMEVEREVTHLVEDSLQGLPEIRGSESVSRSGEMIVWLRLDETASLLNMRSQVAGGLDSISWPEEVLEPELLTEPAGPILLVALHGEAGDTSALTRVCSLYLVSEPKEIWHDETARCIRVQATARGDAAALREALKQPLTRIQERLSASDSG